MSWRKLDPVQALIDMSVHEPEKIKEKQRLLKSRAFELHYSRQGPSAGGFWPKDEKGLPMRDAFDISMDHALGWHSGTEPDVRVGTITECYGAGTLDTVKNRCVPNKK